MIKNIQSLIGFLIITFSVSALGSWITDINKEPWYSTLQKSSLTPPGWVFGVVWPLLYLLMALAIWIAWNKAKGKEKKNLLWLYGIQLVVNASWTPVFFGLHNVLCGLLLILLLIVCITSLMLVYYPKHIISLYLMIPYLLWSCFAFFLNTQVYLLN